MAIECLGAKAQLGDPVEISMRVQNGVIKIGCPFVEGGYCLAA